MIHSLKPYSSYKKSGVEWLGAVPGHWEVLPNRALFHEINERDHPDEQMLSVTITKGVIPQKNLFADSSKKDTSNQDKSAYKLVRPGDIVYNKMRAWQGAIGVSEYRGIVSPAYVVQRLSERGLSGYFHYLLRTPFFAKEAERWSYGITSDMWSLRPEHFKMIYGCLPPYPEQITIVRYLKFVDRRIRRYIRDKQKLIKLLEEQKQVIIHHAVTRGLNPDAKFKPSCIEWLGDIPAHWETQLNQRIFKEQIRSYCGQNEIQLSLSQRDGLIPTSEMQERSLQTSTFDNWKITLPGDIVLNRFKAHLGVFFAATLRGIVSFHYGVFAPRRQMLPKYFELLYHTRPYRTIYAGRSNGMTIGLQNLSNQNFYNVKSIVPPYSEQLQIVSFSEEVIKRTSDLINRTRREIELLFEYHTRIIADVVTGKLDVRQASAHLPDEEEGPVSIDESADNEADMDTEGISEEAEG